VFGLRVGGIAPNTIRILNQILQRNTLQVQFAWRHLLSRPFVVQPGSNFIDDASNAGFCAGVRDAAGIAAIVNVITL
jgi:hypothetical protein